MRKRTGPFVLPLLAFALSAALYLMVMVAARITPFGDNTMIIWDALEQESAFFTHWRGVLLGQNDLFYALSRGLGYGMAGEIGFYLASPLNVLFLLFPAGAMPLGYSFVTLVKLGLCGLTCMVFLQRAHRCGAAGLLFSTSYALSGMLAMYVFRLPWLDVPILLPLIALGIVRIVRERKPLLYLLALGLALLSQYYFGYMACLFSVLYLAYVLLQGRADAPYPKGARIRILGMFAGASLLAAGLAAVLLIPVAASLTLGYQSPDPALFAFSAKASLPVLLTKAYTGAMSIIQLRDGLPNYYVGIPLLAFVGLYFLNKRIPLGKRLVSLGFAGVFVASFLIVVLYYAWHAFETPTYYAARFSFLFSFLLIELAFLGYRGLPDMGARRRNWAAAGMGAGFIVLTALLFRNFMLEYLAPKTIVMDAAFFLLTCGLIVLFAKRRRLCIVLLCAMQAVCLAGNAYYGLVRLNVVYAATDSGYRAAAEEHADILSLLRAEDGGLFRMEYNYEFSHNDPLAYGYMGITDSSSDVNGALAAFAGKLGFRYSDFFIKYGNGTTPVLESLLGIKYVVQREADTLETPPEDYRLLWTDGDLSVYENPFAMPLAYLAPRQETDLGSGNPFENQNIVLSDLTGGQAAPVFEPVTEIESDLDGDWMTYTFPVSAGRRLYLHSMGDYYGFGGTDYVTKQVFNGMIALPVQTEDTVLALRMAKPHGISLAYFDRDAFRAAWAALSPYAATVESDTDSHLVITANATDDRTQLLITVPYEAGWRAWVDGKPAETTSRYGALLAVNLTRGAHTVELRYRPVGLAAGAAVSFVSLLIVIAWMLMRKRKRNGETTK